MYNVCAHYAGTTILLDSFETKDQAEDFMKNDYVLVYAEEMENGEDDEIIKADEMFLEDEIPFFEQMTDLMDWYNNIDSDELPF